MTHQPGDDRTRLVARLEVQGRTAGALGSALYAHLLAGAAADVAAGGPCWRVLAPFAHEPDAHAVPLRFMAAVHRLVLRRAAPALAAHYPSVGGQADAADAWPAFLATVEAHADALADLTALPCQTNEVGRAAALAPALLHLRDRLGGPPVALLEIGTSAGLNLRLDRFRYGTADGTATWGDPTSPVDLTGHWVRAPQGLPPTMGVGWRRGCDPAPGDPTDPLVQEGLTASVWGDQVDRHARLGGALALAAEVPVQVDAAGAGEWLADVLPGRPDGLTAVVHSVVWRYLPADERLQVERVLADHGRGATPGRPLVWVRLEPNPPESTYDGTPYPITATTWPGGGTVVLGTAQAHGQEMTWAAT